jgi:outer membrane receptor protein involved in Fe transport
VFLLGLTFQFHSHVWFTGVTLGPRFCGYLRSKLQKWYQKFRLKSDLGIYGVDTWHFKRLAISAGLRWEYLNNYIEKQTAPGGRFVGERNFPQVDCGTVKGLSCFKNWSPRLGVVYDVFGNHKTAIKGGIGKYNTPVVTSNLNAFNPMYTASQAIPWLNRPTAAC